MSELPRRLPSWCRLDRIGPPEAYTYMEQIGIEIATGERAPEEGDVLAGMLSHTMHQRTGLDRAGLRTRYAWAWRDVAREYPLWQHQAERDIVRTVKPLIGIGAPSNRILAEAHNVNGEYEFILSEDAVTDIAAAEVYWAMERAKHAPAR